MKLIAVSIILCLIISICYGRLEDCLFGFCFGISYLSAIYLMHWISDYFYRKRQIEKIMRDLDFALSPDFFKKYGDKKNTD